MYGLWMDKDEGFYYRNNIVSVISFLAEKVCWLACEHEEVMLASLDFENAFAIACDVVGNFVDLVSLYEWKMVIYIIEW